MTIMIQKILKSFQQITFHWIIKKKLLPWHILNGVWLLHRETVLLVKRKDYTQRWKEDVEKGGTRLDKLRTIDSETFDRFSKARRYFEQIKMQKNNLYKKQIFCYIFKNIIYITVLHDNVSFT